MQGTIDDYDDYLSPWGYRNPNHQKKNRKMNRNNKNYSEALMDLKRLVYTK